jgi:hypothetical protein
MADQYTRSLAAGVTMKPIAALKLSGRLLIARTFLASCRMPTSGRKITDAD